MSTNFIFAYFQRGGPFMYPLFLFFFAALFFIIERIITFIRFNWNASFTLTDITGIKYQDDSNKFIAILMNNYQNFKNNGEKFNKFMEIEAQDVISYLENNLNYLTAIATLAPITGFLGTVSGMIIAFRDITNATDVSPQLVAGGIYEALITTATGLMITIFTTFFYFLFIGKIRSYTSNMEKTVNQIFKIIESSTKS